MTVQDNSLRSKWRSLRRRLTRTRAVLWIGAWPLSLWMLWCWRTTRWEIEGIDALEAELAGGTVIEIGWHEHILVMVPLWPEGAGTRHALRSDSPIGRVGGLVQEYFGLIPIPIPKKGSNLAGTRSVLAGLRDGVSVGIAADGPSGPARVLKSAPIDWAAASGRPIYMFSFATKRGKRLSSWDKMVVPIPYDRGVALFRKLDVAVPRRMGAEAKQAMQHDIAAALTALEEEAQARLDQLS